MTLTTVTVTPVPNGFWTIWLIKRCKTPWTARDKGRALVVLMLSMWVLSVFYAVLIMGVR